jgi:ABC-type Zn2+ transport system substrate-binding protein/surface adhesin
MQNQINLETMSIEGCKALAYDLIAQSEQLNANLRAVNEAIAKKSKELTEEVKKVGGKGK